MGFMGQVFKLYDKMGQFIKKMGFMGRMGGL
jgi:hypothetical protein